MPIRKLSGADAVKNLRENPYAEWPTRDDGRVEPLCKPAFAAKFRLEPGDRIFAIGSCFARHVERALAIRGFDVVTSRTPIGPRGESFFAQFGSGIFNNYGVPSILNELEWALSPERPFVPANNIFEVAPGRYIDIHLPLSAKPAPLELVVERRQALQDVVRKVVDCRLVVMTLGLNEVWFDTATGRYINQTVPRSLVARFPDRFELHLLNYRETAGYLREIVALLRARSRSDQRLLLTVSPVPLAATHTGEDVIATNCYSKSVLRIAAEEIAAENDHVDYLPVYESVTLSDRAEAWDDDLRHVRDGMVKLNVERMIAAFRPADPQEPTPETIAQALREAQDELDARDPYAALRHLEPLRGHLSLSPPLAVLYSDLCLRMGRVSEARAALQQVSSDQAGWRHSLLEATALLRDGRPEEALPKLVDLTKTERKRSAVWLRLTEAYIELKRWNDAVLAAKHWSEAAPRSAEPYRYLADIFRAQEKFEQAELAYRAALDQEIRPTNIALDYAEFMIEQGKDDRAAAILSLLAPENRVQRQRYDKLIILAPPIPAPNAGLRDENGKSTRATIWTETIPNLTTADPAPESTDAGDREIIREAQTLSRDDRFDDAIALVEPLLLRQSPYAAMAYRITGLAHLKSKRPSEAEQAFRAFLKLRDDPNVRGHLGNALTMQGNVEAGIDELRVAANLEPENPFWAARLGAILFAARRFAEAGDVVTQALARHHPGDARLENLKQRLHEARK